MSDEEWLVTASARPGDKPYANSIIRWCAMCGCDVWLSPMAIMRLNDDHKLKPICLECAVPMMAEHESVVGRAVDPTAPEAPEILKLMRGLIASARKARP